MSDKYDYLLRWRVNCFSLTEQTIAWGQSFSGVGVDKHDLNASASSNLAVLYSVDDTSVAELQ